MAGSGSVADCRFGLRCTRVGCYFVHPAGWNPAPAPAPAPAPTVVCTGSCGQTVPLGGYRGPHHRFVCYTCRTAAAAAAPVAPAALTEAEHDEIDADMYEFLAAMEGAGGDGGDEIHVLSEEEEAALVAYQAAQSGRVLTEDEEMDEFFDATS